MPWSHWAPVMDPDRWKDTVLQALLLQAQHPACCPPVSMTREQALTTSWAG